MLTLDSLAIMASETAANPATVPVSDVDIEKIASRQAHSITPPKELLADAADAELLGT